MRLQYLPSKIFYRVKGAYHVVLPPGANYLVQATLRTECFNGVLSEPISRHLLRRPCCNVRLLAKTLSAFRAIAKNRAAKISPMPCGTEVRRGYESASVKCGRRRENKETRTVETSKLHRTGIPSKWFRMTAVLQEFPASPLFEDLKITTTMSSRQLPVCSKNPRHFL